MVNVRRISREHIKVLSGLNSQWVTHSSNGLHSNGHPQWRMVQLETAKLLELGCVLPATNLPHFQMWVWDGMGLECIGWDRLLGTRLDVKGQTVPVEILHLVLHWRNSYCFDQHRYRWAFVGGVNDDYLPEAASAAAAEMVNGCTGALATHSVFVPHVTRIARLMDLRFTTHSPVRRTVPRWKFNWSIPFRVHLIADLEWNRMELEIRIWSELQAWRFRMELMGNMYL